MGLKAKKDIGRFLRFQSTHPVRGGTVIANPLLSGILISIHPPREGWDVDAIGGFNVLPISIHPPREGWDLALLTTMLIKRLFQSTHPVRGGTGELVR